MKILYVVDKDAADKLRQLGAHEISTQYGIKQDVWLFSYDDAKRLCFDINDAMDSKKCFVRDSFLMTF